MIYNYDYEEPPCHDTGFCLAGAGAKGITNCVYCGKELLEHEGEWYTYDAVWQNNYTHPQQKQ